MSMNIGVVILLSPCSVALTSSSDLMHRLSNDHLPLLLCPSRLMSHYQAAVLQKMPEVVVTSKNRGLRACCSEEILAGSRNH